MDRRNLVALLGGGILAWPIEIQAQEPGRTYRVGGLSNLPPGNSLQITWLAALRPLGFIEGQNLLVDQRGWSVRAEQFPEVAADLVKAQVDVIIAGGNPAIRAAQQATATIPILGFTDDMVGSGLVASMAHPDGNTTGISLLATELEGKRQEILIEIVPGARHIAALTDSATTASRRLQALRDAAQTRGIELSLYLVAKAGEIGDAIGAAKAAGVAALNVLASPLLYAQRRLIIERTAALGLPAIYPWPETAEEGGLAGYGPRIIQLYRDEFPRQLVKLLKGSKPADIPIEQPTTFELVINLKTAKAIGLMIPESVLDRADKAIE
jgi:putative tryptophan/tyrosine transport system substrate-binding protein